MKNIELIIKSFKCIYFVAKREKENKILPFVKVTFLFNLFIPYFMTIDAYQISVLPSTFSSDRGDLMVILKI